MYTTTQSSDDYLQSLAQFHQDTNFEDFVLWELKILMRQAPEEIMLIKILDYVRNHQDNQVLDQEIEDDLKKYLFLD